MADPEFRLGPPDPPFVKALDAATRRRSRASHGSAAASTRSWTLMNQQGQPPLPRPSPSRSPVGTGAASAAGTPRGGVGHMSIDVASATEAEEMRYKWGAGKHREGNGFVGGFVSGLRRMPPARQDAAREAPCTSSPISRARKARPRPSRCAPKIGG
jgi:hypothetical protein